MNELNHSNCLLDRKLFFLSLSPSFFFDKIVYLSNTNTKVWLSYFPFSIRLIPSSQSLAISLSPFCFYWNNNFQENYVKLTEPPSWFVAYTLYLFNLLIRFISTDTNSHSLTWHRFHPVDKRQYTHPIHPSCVYSAEWWSCLPMAICTWIHNFPFILMSFHSISLSMSSPSLSLSTVFLLSNNSSTYITYHFESFISELSSSIPIRPNRWASTFDIYGLIQVHAMIYPVS